MRKGRLLLKGDQASDSSLDRKKKEIMLCFKVSWVSLLAFSHKREAYLSLFLVKLCLEDNNYAFKLLF